MIISSISNEELDALLGWFYAAAGEGLAGDDLDLRILRDLNIIAGAREFDSDNRRCANAVIPRSSRVSIDCAACGSYGHLARDCPAVG